MTVFGKTISEYVRFMHPFIVLIFAVGIARLTLSLAGVENSIVQWISISIVSGVAWLYYSVKAHTSGFGTYKHLLPVNVIQGVVGNFVIASGIAIAIFTGKDNVFSIPENSGGVDGKTWFHAGAHLLAGATLGALVFWILGCAIMFITKKIAPRPMSR